MIDLSGARTSCQQVSPVFGHGRERTRMDKNGQERKGEIIMISGPNRFFGKRLDRSFVDPDLSWSWAANMDRFING